MDILDKILTHPDNEKVLNFLFGSPIIDDLQNIFLTPDKVKDITRWAEAWADIWDELGRNLPEETKYMIGQNALLVHPTTGLIFGFGDGRSRFNCGLRQPNYKRPADALKNEGRQVVENMNGIEYDLRAAGDDWIVGNFLRDGQRQTQIAYELAGEIRR